MLLGQVRISRVFYVTFCSTRCHSVVGRTPPVRVHRGWVMNRIEAGDAMLVFSRRYDTETLQRLVEDLGMEINSEDQTVDRSQLSQEFM